MNKLLLIVLFCFQCTLIHSQSLERNWYSEKHNSCIKFDTLSNLMMINGLYEDFDSNWKKRIEYEIEGNILKIKWVNSQNWLWMWTSDKSEWEIIEHTDKTLQLKYVSGDGKIATILGSEIITFTHMEGYDCNKYVQMNYQ